MARGSAPTERGELAAAPRNDAIHAVVARQLAHGIAERALGEVGEREEGALPLQNREETSQS